MTKKEAIAAIGSDPSIVDTLFKTLHIYEPSERERLCNPVSAMETIGVCERACASQQASEITEPTNA